MCVGAAVHAVASAEYGWLQVLGSACVEVEGTLSVGLPVVTSDTDIGTVETIAAGAHELLQIVGVAQTAGSAGEFAAVKLNVL